MTEVRGTARRLAPGRSRTGEMAVSPAQVLVALLILAAVAAVVVGAVGKAL